jgi:hypothetical protein
MLNDKMTCRSAHGTSVVSLTTEQDAAASGVSSPAMMRNNVVLPQPDGPVVPPVRPTSRPGSHHPAAEKVTKNSADIAECSWCGLLQTVDAWRTTVLAASYAAIQQMTMPA